MKLVARLTFVFLFVMGLIPVKAQNNVTIRGEVVGGAGKEVSLYRYSDMLTRTEVLVDHVIIEQNHTFELHGYTNYTTMMFLQIENYSQSFYVEPGREYEVYIPRFDWDVDEKKNVFLDPEVLPLEFVNMPSDDLNALITRFDAAVADYIDGHKVFFDPRFRPQRRYFDSLEVAVNKAVPNTNNEFFNRYKRYHLAELRYTMRFESRRHTVEKYIQGQPVMYYDDNYMSLFTTVFANSVAKGMRKISATRLGQLVSSLKVDQFLDSLGTDSLLHNEQVRELVALQALQEAYYLPRYYESDKVVRMIDMIGAKSKFSDHRTLAQHLAAGLRAKEKGVEVASFTLPDVDKQMVSLEAMKGKWVYLSFVRVGDPNCIGEVETMAHFKDSIYAKNSNVEFVTICCDREFQKMYHFLKNTKKGKRYNWTWLHFNGNYKLLEQYQVVSYPSFILINPDGQMQYTVTPSPASGFLLNAPWQPKKEVEEKPFFLR